MSDDREVDFHFQNYPAEGENAVIQEVLFGPPSTKFTLLIEVDIETEELSVVIGNGPPNALVPQLIPEVLGNVADIIAGLEDALDTEN